MIKHHKLPEGVTERLGRLNPVFERDRRIVFAYLFGGLAQGIQKPLSDVDIAVYLDDRCNKAEMKLELIGMVSDILGTDEIDLVILNDAPVSLAGRILKKKRVIMDRQPFLRHAYESRIMREFFDFSRKERDILFRRFA